MAPELAGAYVVGMIPSLTVTALQGLKYQRKIKSTPYLQLQKNLNQVGKYWSEVESGVGELKPDSFFQEQQKFQRTLWIMGALFMFLSWGGFIFNLIVYVSIHHLAITRFEQKVFASELTRKDLSPREVEEALKEVSG